jgi:hypothetical protein
MNPQGPNSKSVRCGECRSHVKLICQEIICSNEQRPLYGIVEVHCILEKLWCHHYDIVAVTSGRADKQEAFVHTV